MGITGLLEIVLPYFLPLLFLTSLIEDSGYLARVAFLIDGVMHKIGLHGKSVVPFILGFGCSIPAIYATRIIDNKKEKLITAILIPFIPCSARTSVIFAMAAAITGPVWAIVIYLYVIFIIALNGKVMSIFISKPMGLILEIPSLKLPSLMNILNKTWFKIVEFGKSAGLYLIIGSMVLGWIEYFNVAKYINIIFSPIVQTILGLPKEVSTTLVFGFFRKELLLVMLTQAFQVKDLSHLPMTINQSVVFIIFSILYFPCFATFIVLMKEFGKKTVTISALLCLFVATLSALIFNIILNL
jgi:ferrous iron transport protein B